MHTLIQSPRATTAQEEELAITVLPARTALVSIRDYAPTSVVPGTGPFTPRQRLDVRLSGQLESLVREFIAGNVAVAPALASALVDEPDSVRVVRNAGGLIRRLHSLIDSAGSDNVDMLADLLALVNGPAGSLAPSIVDVCVEGASTILLRQEATATTASSSSDRVNQRVGLRLWGAAVLLTELIARNPTAFSGKRVLEIGGGLGLCGLAAAKHASEVVVSDFNVDVLDAARYNARLNGADNVRVQRMDWDCVVCTAAAAAGDADDDADACASCEVRGRFDWVIAADVVCQPSDCDGVARVLKRRMGGRALVVLGSARSRFGVDAFERAMHAHGLQCAAVAVDVPVLESDFVGAADGYCTYVLS